MSCFPRLPEVESANREAKLMADFNRGCYAAELNRNEPDRSSPAWMRAVEVAQRAQAAAGIQVDDLAGKSDQQQLSMEGDSDASL